MFSNFLGKIDRLYENINKPSLKFAQIHFLQEMNLREFQNFEF